ncbi:MAG: Histidine ammonia-lyase, partial [Bacteroidetes bacterium]|nr:Histidine ammonia-lyase [Bacteroidota bacterium]
MKTVFLDGSSLTVPLVYDIACNEHDVALSGRAKKNVRAARRLVEKWVNSDETIYGVNTGFGELSNVRVSHHDIEKLQENLIFSHAAGAGEPLPSEVVRAMMALRVNALAKGFSGVRLETLNLLIGMLNKGLVPVIPSHGSVGASGDLVQLAHLVLAMMGRGSVYQKGKAEGSAKALRSAGLKSVQLKAKEGLALINGTQMMTAYAALAVRHSADL